MKITNFKSERPKGRLFRRVSKQLSIDRLYDQFQGVLFHVDQFGCCAGLTMGFFMLISFLLHAVHSGAEKGVI
jgi:hypothetical protein